MKDKNIRLKKDLLVLEKVERSASNVAFLVTIALLPGIVKYSIEARVNAGLTLYFSNALSTITILSSSFLKVPQVINLIQKQTSQGIHVNTMVLEVSGFSIMTLYNFVHGYRIITYLEYPIILVQVYVMTYYVLKFKGLLCSPAVVTATLGYFFLVILIVLEVIPKLALSFLLPLCTPLSGFVKLSYIHGMVQAGNADAVSVSSWAISVFTNSVRIFTIYMDSGDVKLLINFMISLTLSFSVLLTAIYYKQLSKPAPLMQ